MFVSAFVGSSMGAHFLRVLTVNSPWSVSLHPLRSRDVSPTVRRTVAESTHRHETYNRWALPLLPHKTAM